MLPISLIMKTGSLHGYGIGGYGKSGRGGRMKNIGFIPNSYHLSFSPMDFRLSRE